MSQTVDVFRDAELIEMFSDDLGLLAISDAIAQSRPVTRHRRSVRPILIAATAALLVVAAPALAFRSTVIDFFTGAPASPAAVLNFAQLDRGAPAGMDVRADPTQARTVASHVLADGSTITLYAAPTATGGFCYLVSVTSHALAGGCDARREIPFGAGFAADTYPDATAIVHGSILDPDARKAEVADADGHTTSLPLERVSAPIDASLYFGTVPITRESFPLTTTIRDGDGKILATKTIPAPPAP